MTTEKLLADALRKIRDCMVLVMRRGAAEPVTIGVWIDDLDAALAAHNAPPAATEDARDGDKSCIAYIVEKKLDDEWTPMRMAKISDFPNAIYQRTLEQGERIRGYTRVAHAAIASERGKGK